MIKDIDKTYVGIVDILGFKELAYCNDHNELIRIYGIFEESIKRSLTLFNGTIEENEYHSNFDLTKVNSLMISDSVILWTNDLKYHNFFNLLVAFRAILSEAMRCGIPMRGAIVSGPISIRKEIISKSADTIKLTCFGKSIVDGYLLSERQNWSGGIITKVCIDDYENAVNDFKASQNKYSSEQIDIALSLESLIRKLLLRKYLVPLKDGEIKEEYVVNWVNELDPKMTEYSIRKSFEKFNKKVNNWKVESLIRNTIDFTNDCP